MALLLSRTLFRKAVCLWNHNWQVELIYCVMFSPLTELCVECLQGPCLTTQGCSAKAPWGLMVMLWAHQETCTSLIPAVFFFLTTGPSLPSSWPGCGCCTLFLHCPFFFFKLLILYWRASLVAQMIKNLPAMWETWVWSLVWEDPLEKGKATHSSILAWRIPFTHLLIQI